MDDDVILPHSAHCVYAGLIVLQWQRDLKGRKLQVIHYPLAAYHQVSPKNNVVKKSIIRFYFIT